MEPKATARERFSDRMRELRKMRRVSQRQLGTWTGRSQGRVSSVEAGGDPRLSTLIALSDALRAELVPVPIERLSEVERLLGMAPSAVEEPPSSLDRFFISAADEEDEK